MIDRGSLSHLIRRMKKRKRCRLPALVPHLAGVLAIFLTAGPAFAIDILPHRAVYDMRLVKTARDSGVASVQGTLMLTWEDSCDEWVIGQRLFLQISREDLSFTTSTAFDTRESKDGLELSFEDSSIHDPGGVEHAMGRARLIAGSGDGSLIIEEPDPGQYVLPKGTVFPTAQMIDILERALDGERFMSHLVYDGTDGKNLFDVTTAVGEPFDQDVEAAAGGHVVIWPMRIAYYPYGSIDELPEAEIGADIQENGVARRIVFDYGSFAVESKLVSIEALPKAVCD